MVNSSLENSIDTPLVSVIITSYNGIDTLRRAIESVRNQTYDNWELIVVDDNADDLIIRKKTEEIIEDINDSRIKYIKNETHINGACARNVGARYVEGKYIALLDDDDIFLPKRLSRCVDVLESSDGYEGVITAGFHVGDGVLCGSFSGIKYENPLKAMFYGFGILGTGSNVFVTKNAWDELGGFDESFLIRQDIEFMIRFMSSFNCYMLDEDLVIKCGTTRKGKAIEYNRIRNGDLHFYSVFSEKIDELFSDDEKYDIYNRKFTWLFRVGLTSSEKDVITAVEDLRKIRKLTLKENIMFSFNKIYRALKNVPALYALKNRIQNRKKFYFSPSPELIEIFKLYNISYNSK